MYAVMTFQRNVWESFRLPFRNSLFQTANQKSLINSKIQFPQSPSFSRAKPAKRNERATGTRMRTNKYQLGLIGNSLHPSFARIIAVCDNVVAKTVVLMQRCRKNAPNLFKITTTKRRPYFRSILQMLSFLLTLIKCFLFGWVYFQSFHYINYTAIRPQK